MAKRFGVEVVVYGVSKQQMQMWGRKTNLFDFQYRGVSGVDFFWRLTLFGWVVETHRLQCETHT